MKIDTQKIFSRIFFMVALAAIVSCNSKVSRDRDNDYENAQSLIGEGRNDEAIQMLGDDLNADPQDMKTRLLLATAYASRAGIYLGDFTDFAQAIAKSSREVDEIMDRRGGVFEKMKGKGADEAKIVVAFEKLMRATLRIDGLVRGFNYLPTPKSPEQLQDLSTAIDVMNGESRYRGGPALYRALLKISYFKFDLKNRYDFTSISHCSINTYKLSRQIDRLRSDIFGIINDIGFGMMTPERQMMIENFSSKLDEDMRLAVKALDELDDKAVDVSLIVRQLNGSCHD